MNLGEMKTAVERYGFDDTDPLTTWINAAMFELLDSPDYDWVFLEKIDTTLTLSGGANQLTLPADCGKPKSIRDTTNEGSNGGGLNLDIVSFQRWGDIANQQSTGDPTIATLIGLDTVVVWPVPVSSRTFTLLYHKTVDPLDDDADEPDMPNEFHYPIVRLAAATGLMAESEEDRSETALALYQNDLVRLSEKYASRHFANFDQVREG